MAKREVSLKLDPGEREALKAFAKEHGLTLSAAGRALIRQGLRMNGHEELRDVTRQLAIIEKRSRRAQIASYRAYAGIVELIRFIAKDAPQVAREIQDSLVEKSSETLRKEEDRGDYR